MKYAFTLFLIIMMFNAKAQTSKTPYFPEPDLKRFTGKWQYIHHDTTFTINLFLEKKYIDDSGDGIYTDFLQGDYSLKIDDKITQVTSNLQGIKSGGYINSDISKNKIRFLFYDLGKRSKSGLVIFEITNSEANEATWLLSNMEGVHIGYFDYSYSVPTKAVFKKVN